jgi:glutaredoxin 3
MPKKVTIFTTNTCAYCQMVKKYLTSKSVEYEVVNLDEHPERQAEAQRISGALTVPVTAITHQDDTQEVVIGWNPARLAGAIA